jgi:hypothetical protein
VLLDDASTGEGDSHVQSLAHGVITLEQISPHYGASRRRLIVRKSSKLKTSPAGSRGWMPCWAEASRGGPAIFSPARRAPENRRSR